MSENAPVKTAPDDTMPIQAKPMQNHEDVKYGAILNSIDELEGKIEVLCKSVVTMLAILVKKEKNKESDEREWLVCHTCGGRKKVQRAGRTYSEDCPTCDATGQIELI